MLEIRKDAYGNSGVFGEKFIRLFLTEDKLKVAPPSGKHLIYVTYLLRENKSFVKIGGTDTSIINRYKSGNTNITQMIGLYVSEKWDKEIIAVLKSRAKNNIGFRFLTKEESPWGTSCVESFEIESEDGLQNFLDIVESETHEQIVEKFNGEPYPDVELLILEILRLNAKYNLEDLPPRYTKTRTTCEIIKRLGKSCRIAILGSYVGTVRTSYKEELALNIRYENIKFFDPDIDPEAEITKWLTSNPDHQVLYYVAMTGSNNDKETEIENGVFERRTEILKKFKNMTSVIFIEEADFGCHCDKQVEKIQSLFNFMKCKKFFGMTGTGAEKIFKIFPDKKFEIFSRDYFIDVLPRPNAVGIHWHIMQNDLLAKICGPKVMENWNALFKINENGKFEEELYIKKLLQFLFDGGDSSVDRNIRKASTKLIDTNFATEIFTAGGKDVHKVLKELIENTFPNILVKIIDGDETTNKEAEKMAKDAIKDAKKTNKRVVFIASIMGVRSFSVGQIKNIILMFNDGSHAAISQKISRALTPYLNCKFANIIDLRLNYSANTCLETYMQALAMKAINGNLNGRIQNEATYIKEILASGKIIFDEYTANGINPIKELKGDDLLIMARGSSDFITKKADLVLIANESKIKNPDICLIENDMNFSLNEILNNKNVKGDQDKKIKEKLNIEKIKKNDEDQDEKELSPLELKRRHMKFLFSKSNLFISDFRKYDENKLYNEIIHMSEDRKSYYQNLFGIDMETITDIVKCLYNSGLNLDKFLDKDTLTTEEKKFDKQTLSFIFGKGTLTFEDKNFIWNSFKFNEITKNSKVCLAFLGNPYFYLELIHNGHDKNLLYIIEDETCKVLYKDLNINSSHIQFVKSKNLQNIKNNNLDFFNMKFNNIIMNPPFNDSLHLKILAKAVEHLDPETGKCINLSPVRWLQDPLALDKQNSDFNKYKESVVDHIKSLTLLPLDITNSVFKINFGVLGIYELTPKIFKFDDSVFQNSIVNKIKEFAKKDSVMNHSTHEGPDQNYVGNYGIINSHLGDMENWISENKEMWRKKRYTNTSKMISFSAQNEVDNFFNSLLTSVFKYYVVNVKRNQRNPWQFVPWMGNAINPRTKLKGYKSDWTSEDFCQYFNITNEEQKIIEETVAEIRKRTKVKKVRRGKRK